jgi:hypothetical protein
MHKNVAQKMCVLYGMHIFCATFEQSPVLSMGGWRGISAFPCSIHLKEDYGMILAINYMGWETE